MKTVRAYLCALSIIFIVPALSMAQTFGASDAVEATGSGTINWTTGEVYATGIGPVQESATSPSQNRAMALQVARLDAFRKLLEVVKGVQVDSNTTVQNFMVTSDIIRSRVEGVVKGFRIVKTQYQSDGSVEVTIAMPLRGKLMDVVIPETFGRMTTTPVPVPQIKPVPSVSQPVKQAPPAVKEPVKPEPLKPSTNQTEKKAEPIKPAPAQSAGESTTTFQGGVPTGLVIDARGLGLKPALLPKVVDQQGQEIYVGQIVTRTNAVEQGVAGYARDVNAAANNFRVTDNPAVMKGLAASGAANTDVIVGEADAQTLRQLASRGEFLENCRVIIVY
jgi:hypothetical protein